MSGDRPLSPTPRSRVATAVDTVLALHPITRFFGVGGMILFIGIVAGCASDSSKGIALGIVAGTVGIWAYFGLGVVGPAKR
jgi:hypothetical protein